MTWVWQEPLRVCFPRLPHQCIVGWADQEGSGRSSGHPGDLSQLEVLLLPGHYVFSFDSTKSTEHIIFWLSALLLSPFVLLFEKQRINVSVILEVSSTFTLRPREGLSDESRCTHPRSFQKLMVRTTRTAARSQTHCCQHLAPCFVQTVLLWHHGGPRLHAWLSNREELAFFPSSLITEVIKMLETSRPYI